ncbi:MAG: flavin-dependent oxidoreductase, F420-dependent methylene-tetrahydromethanopterin reductase [Acidimicrobiaceae bacterium]|nr:flavin-dependent oxidoreductase, F420-dependent methylene-tetrahydromethanopterin reductase [Acidimicrobiaceae bacterium]
MKVGIVLPTFAPDAAEAIEAAIQAEDVGLDGCFCYDHLWPIGQPGRPALAPFPLLGALSELTTRIHLGTLVARIGMVPEPVLLDELLTLAELLGGRLIAGLGTGDRLSLPEQQAYGIPVASADERREAVSRLARRLVGAGMKVWVGGRPLATQAAARSAGAIPNLWAAPPSEVASAAETGPVTWGGSLPSDPGLAAERLTAVAVAGAAWAVVPWPGSIGAVLSAADAAGWSPERGFAGDQASE